MRYFALPSTAPDRLRRVSGVLKEDVELYSALHSSTYSAPERSTALQLSQRSTLYILYTSLRCVRRTTHTDEGGRTGSARARVCVCVVSRMLLVFWGCVLC